MILFDMNNNASNLITIIFNLRGLKVFYNRRYFLNFRRYLKKIRPGVWGPPEGCKGSRGALSPGSS
jgi:hypothetical protein